MKHGIKYPATKKQKEFLKKLGCTTWDKQRSKQEASRLIAGYLNPVVRFQVQQDMFHDSNENNLTASSYSLSKKQYWESAWKNRPLATQRQRAALRKMGYQYWNSSLLTFSEAQEKCRQMWNGKPAAWSN